MSPMPPEIEHIVVLMMENRSFDNVLGSLYMPQYSPPRVAPAGWQGLTGNESNTVAQIKPTETIKVWNWRNPPSGYLQPSPFNPYTMPCPNDHEHYSYVWWELYGGEEKPPGAVPLPPTRQPSMEGFASTYYDKVSEVIAATGGATAPTLAQYAQIMHYLAPADLPVTSALAYDFGVCDRWFASVPTQTYANRWFALIGTSNGIVNNDQWLGYCGEESPTSACTEEPGAGYVYAESIFHRLDGSDLSLTSPTWKVYYTTHAIAEQISYVHDHRSSNTEPIEQFFTDLTDETLPSFAWLEPGYGSDGNSNHPPENVLLGEKLILELFQAIQSSSYWEKTLFIITYDEHGGLYDHVPPPSNMIAPTRELQNSKCYAPANSGFPPQYEKNFDFTRYGVRVPTILISPWIAPGTLLKTSGGTPAQFEHTSLLSSVFDTFGISQPLDERDASAPTVADVFTNLDRQPNHGPKLPSTILPPKGSPPNPYSACSDARDEDNPLIKFEAAAQAAARKE